MTLFLLFLFGLLILIGFAIYKKDSVRATINFRSAGFSLEAKNNDPKGPNLSS
jgi:hypothetical protein